jgi:hypothetical protein
MLCACATELPAINAIAEAEIRSGCFMVAFLSASPISRAPIDRRSREERMVQGRVPDFSALDPHIRSDH